MIGPETCVIPLQNGVEAHGQLAGVLGEERVLVGLCGTLSWVVGPGHIRNAGGHDFMKFGELSNARSDRVERLHQAFTQAGVTAEVPADIHKALWDKFLLVTSFGGVGAVTRASR
jgi:2-dehydropantoate 2-reductase